ncbi:MAG: type II toxin-antitoxin system VapC family toxin [Sporichthyaceae bacterium]
MRYYVDTSAAAKLLVEESETVALKTYLNSVAANSGELMASALVETELRRLAVRADLEQEQVSDVLLRCDVLDLPRAAFRTAGVVPGAALRSLDALHLTMALRVGADVLVAYDHRLIAAARLLGMQVSSPGR